MRSMTTLKDIASMIGVSVTTVSKSLRNHPDISLKKKEQILEAARKLNYIPNATARHLRKQKTNIICVMISDNTNPYYASFLKSVEEVASAHDFFTIMSNSNEIPSSEISFIANLRSLNAAGVIITPALDGKESIKLLRSSGVPFVIANRYVTRNKDNYVVADDEEAGYMATNYVLNIRGNSDVLFLGPSRQVSSAQDRVEGYERAMRERSMRIDSENIISGVFTQEQAYSAAKVVIYKHRPPYSIVCYSDYIASGVCKALSESGVLVPKEVGIVGIDNIGLFSFIHPSLTTVEIPKEEIGRRSAELLFRLIEKGENEESIADEQIVLKPTLIVRESV